jgi:predicted transposase/invertase (TIGR01784 family)
LGVSGKKRNFAVKLNVELNEWRMKQVEEWEYEASKMAYRDIKNSIDTAKQEGKQEGLAEGMELGIEKGMNQKALDIARNMLADGVDINLIMKYSGLTQEQIEKLK